jgi:4-hydroxybenzoate polyprenyltransferase
MAHRVAALLAAAHPGPALAVTLGAAGLASAAGQNVRGVATCAAMVLAGQLSIGWSNDALDWRRDVATGRQDKPIACGAIGPRIVWRAAAVAAVTCAPISLAYGLGAGATHLAAVGSGWAYNVGLKRTVWSWLPYALSFGLLPAFVLLGLPGTPLPPVWAVAAGSLLGVGAHLANVLPDIDDDLVTGVRGLPHRLGRRPASWLATLALLAATVALVAGPAGEVDTLGWAALAVVGGLTLLGTAVGVRRPRAPFLMTIAAAGVDVVLLIARGPTLT